MDEIAVGVAAMFVDRARCRREAVLRLSAVVRSGELNTHSSCPNVVWNRRLIAVRNDVLRDNEKG